MGYEETCIPEILLNRVEPALRQRPLLLTKLLYKLVRLYHSTLLLKEILVNLIHVEEVYWKENIRRPSLHQVTAKVLLLMTLLPLTRHDRSPNTWHGGEELIKVTHDEVSVGNVGGCPLHVIEEESGKEQVLALFSLLIDS
jgi:hypothetical protein